MISSELYLYIPAETLPVSPFDTFWCLRGTWMLVFLVLLLWLSCVLCVVAPVLVFQVSREAGAIAEK